MIANIVILDKNGNTPLHDACYGGKVKVVECLLEFKADTSIKSESILLVYFDLLNWASVDNKGRTALQWARGRGEEHVVRMLLQHGIVE